MVMLFYSRDESKQNKQDAGNCRLVASTTLCKRTIRCVSTRAVWRSTGSIEIAMNAGCSQSSPRVEVNRCSVRIFSMAYCD